MTLWRELLRLDVDHLAADRASALLACCRLAITEIARYTRKAGQAADGLAARDLAQCLVELAQVDWDGVGEDLKVAWIATALDLSRCAEEESLCQHLISAAALLAGSGQYADEVRAFGLVVRSRRYFISGDLFLAAVAAREAILLAPGNLELVSAAREILAKTNFNLHQDDDEFDTLKGWFLAWGDQQGGLLQQAGRYMMEGTSKRAEEMLLAASRLIILTDSRDRDLALALYAAFRAVALSDWRDPRYPELGTIHEREQRLLNVGSDPPLSASSSLLFLVETRSANGLPTTPEQWEQAMAEFARLPADRYRALVSDKETLNANRFKAPLEKSTVLDLYCRLLREVLDQSCQDLRPQVIPLHQGNAVLGRELNWLLLQYDSGSDDLADLHFAVRPAVVGEELELALFPVFSLPPHEVRDLALVSARLRFGRYEHLAGYPTVSQRVVEALIDAGERLESHADADRQRPVSAMVP
jgi:hypothetical protein